METIATTSPVEIVARRRGCVREAVAAALASGLRYNTDVDRFVDGRCLALDEAVDAFAGEYALTGAWREQNAARAAIDAKIAAAPRGTWARFRCTHPSDGRVWYKASMSEGCGQLTKACSHDTYDQQPTFEQLFQRMRESETYDIRQDLANERAYAAQMDALATYKFAVGQTFRNVNLGTHGHANRIELTAVDAATGDIKFNLIKRGSRKRYSGSTTALGLVRSANLQPPAAGQIRSAAEISPASGLPLFAPS